MIKLCRVDHRLLHGQVAVSWCSSLDINCILVANDKVAEDELWKQTLRLAKPATSKLVMKNIDDSIAAINSGATDKYNLLILVENVQDAKKLAINVPDIKEVNLGGAKSKEGSKVLGKVFYYDSQDKKDLTEMAQNGITLEVRQIPGDSKIDVTEKFK